MDDRLPGLILGYHGCERAEGESVLGGKAELRPSRNEYDWLGHGIYFWEHNARRAIHYARMLQVVRRPKNRLIKEPMVIGAVIDLGLCLNLLDAQFLEQLPIAYQSLRLVHEHAGKPMPKNRPLRESNDPLLRNLDCAVIEALHQLRSDEKKPAFDSARGVFVEGDPIYPGAAIQQFNHIQICIRNPGCVTGYFRLREDFR